MSNERNIRRWPEVAAELAEALKRAEELTRELAEHPLTENELLGSIAVQSVTTARQTAEHLIACERERAL